MHKTATLNMTEGRPLALLSLTGLGVWAIWVTAGLTWVLAAFFCVLRYFTWRRKHLAGAPLAVVTVQPSA